ncbi:MAG: acetylserotonin O-methyltransferase [Desulfuromonadales bacterium]|nr:acetylserotonin O-methyltransferase [Desulfuromonadales bacterium]
MKPENFRDLMRLVHGFESAKILLVANDLGLFRVLDRERGAVDVAGELGVDTRALELLMNALTALGLLEKGGDGYRNAPVAAQYLADDSYRGHIFRHIHHCWDSWNDLAGVIRRGGPDLVRESVILHDEEAWNRDFIRGMDDVTRELAPQVVSGLDLAGARRLLDVGGGPGTYARAFLAAYPQLTEVTIFDLPFALAVARERLEGYSRRDDVRLLAGDFHKDAFGDGFDAIWISQVLHSQSEAGCRTLLAKAVQALVPGGRLFVHEFLLDDSHAAPLTAALFAVHMLVMTAGGRAYGGSEVAGWLEEAGLVDIEVRKVSDDTGVVQGRKP